MSLQQRGNVLRESSKENQKPRPKAAGNNGKRNALGNVTNQVRRQPLRAAKDKHAVLSARSQENDVPKAGGFKIFEDASARVPALGAPSVFEQQPQQQQPLQQQPLQALPIQDVRPVDDDMGEKENSILDHPIPDAIMGLHRNIGHPGVLQPMLEASPMVVDNSGVNGADEERDEFGVDPYYHDIFEYLKAKEVDLSPGVDFMNRQEDVTMTMRNILVDWLVEVGEEYKLHRETLFLSINYIDRFLSLVRVERPKLQLVGAACMFIAAKYEEIYPPDVGEFVYITDDTYTKRQVLKMESVILKLLEFKVAVPTVNWFCEHYQDSFEDLTETAKHLTFFLAELSLIEIVDFMEFPSSKIAASCLILARSTLSLLPVWPLEMEKNSGYKLYELVPCLTALFQLYKKKSSMPQQAVVEKYKQEKFARVSFIPPPAVLALI